MGALEEHYSYLAAVVTLRYVFREDDGYFVAITRC